MGFPAIYSGLYGRITIAVKHWLFQNLCLSLSAMAMAGP